MATLPLDRRGFFADRNRAFWTLQIGGWTGYFLLRTLGGLANAMGVAFILPAILVTVTGFSITLLMASAYRRIIRMRPVWVWSLTILILGTGAVLFSTIEVWAHATFYRPDWRPKGIEFMGAILLTLAVLGAWTALYYGINYYLMLDEQAERFARLEGQASRAQLEMLRYQLNPHFLFNTLNSISTLVLLGDTEKANAMLSRLSSFLRYTLVGDREGLATVAQEVEALKLYLDIEKIRFGERLRVAFDIAPEAAPARLPSLLLQPLVENAVKYAVTPQEEGADILVSAHAERGRLLVEVADTGPGIGPGGPGPSSEGTGLGLDNIRERLLQAYGADHRFELSPALAPEAVQARQARGEGGGPGLRVTIDLPFQTAREEPSGPAHRAEAALGLATRRPAAPAPLLAAGHEPKEVA
ncbi:MAG: sensor histidine kinase [Thermaurantiacus tibetensis]|uniref:sensor histidine kinase n=1 Tax=Thermaurantiacus tibetensis TaxID=2759035 RepID=UPI001890ABA2|nr:histidine kinase [Thermaurantiacus tibetensis]